MEDRERRSASGAEEAKDEGSSEDVELHRRKMPQADDSTPAEGQSDDDVELHRKQNPA